MDFTFGIITGGGAEEYIKKTILSIEAQQIENYEIIVVGKCELNEKNLKVVEFDESIKNKWITKKKNIITNLSNYENIVYMHDYIYFLDGWYVGQKKSGSDFEIRMDKIFNFNGERFRDWCIWPLNNNSMDQFIGKDCLIPYDIDFLTKYMYISGSYWISKKFVMEKFPLNEGLCWGEGEDVEWSKRIRDKVLFKMNVNSSVQIMKPGKDKAFNEPSEDKIQTLKNKNLWLN